MPRYIPHHYYDSCPSRRGGYGGRGRSPPRGYSTPRRGCSPPKRGGYGGGGTREEQDHGCLLVRNIPLDCRPEELRVPFERFGAVRDVYIPKDYYTGEPRGFAFVKFVDPYEAADARYRMNGQVFAGLEMGVAAAVGSKKRPDEMCRREKRISCGGGNPRYGGRRPYNCRRYRSRSVVSRRSRSPLPRCRGGGPKGPGHRSRSYSPSPWRRAADCSVSLTRPVSASRFPRKRGVRRRSLSPTYVELAGRRKGIGNGYDRECDAVDRGRGEGSGHRVVVLDPDLLTWKQKQMEGCKMRIEAAINGRRKVTAFGRGVLN